MEYIFGILYDIFGWIMRVCYSISFNNYILTLFIFALVMQVILFPFGIKQQKSTVKRASLRPKEEEIMRKYRGRKDRETQQRMQTEIQEMYKENGYSPTAGCLPLLVQFPIIISLFYVVRMPLSYTTSIDNTKIGSFGYNLNDFYQHSYKVIDNQVEVYENGKAELEKQLDLTADENIKADLQEKIEYCKNRIQTIKKIKNDEDKKGLQISGGGNSYRELDLIRFMQNGVDTFYSDVENGYYTNADKEKIYYLKLDNSNSENIVFQTKKTEEDYIKGGFIDKLIIKEEAVRLLAGEKVYNFNDLLKDKGIYSESESEETENYAHSLPNFKFIGNTSILDQPSYKKFNWLLLVPVLVFLSSFWSSEVTRKLGAQPDTAGTAGQPNPLNGGFMRWGMPLMSTVFAFTFPAAIGIYWTVRSVFSVGQQYLLSKMFPAPKFTETELKEAVKEVKQEKKRKKIITIEVDEDDTSYDDIAISEERAEKIRRRREKQQRDNSAEQETASREKGIEKPTLKDKDNGKD